MKIGIKVFLLFIAFAVAVNTLNFVVAFLPQLSIVFAIGCSLGAVWGAFHQHGHGKPLFYGVIEGALWLPKKAFELTIGLCKFVMATTLSRALCALVSIPIARST